MSKADVLEALQRLGGRATAVNVRRHLNTKIDTATIGKYLRRLERDGLVTARRIPGPNSRGLLEWSLTP